MQQHIGLGSAPNDGTGDPLRTGGQKIEDNFTELYAAETLNTLKVTNATHTGDVTGATVLTLATVNANVGSFVNPTMTVNAKGLVTAIATTAHTGDATGSDALTLATVNAAPGTYNAATITVNAKGLVTAASSGVGSAVTKYASTVNLGAGVVTQKITTFTTVPYAITLYDSSINVITHEHAIQLTYSGGFIVLNIYSVDALNNVQIYILY
jgi:hypothetical protein